MNFSLHQKLTVLAAMYHPEIEDSGEDNFGSIATLDTVYAYVILNNLIYSIGV